MSNVTPEIAALRRKHAATQELAKRQEIGNLLRQHGVDPDASEAVSDAPKGRRAPERVTADAPKRATAARAESEDNEATKESAAKTASVRRRPGRPRKSVNTDK